jgi:hypothetical protein
VGDGLLKMKTRLGLGLAYQCLSLSGSACAGEGAAHHGLPRNPRESPKA